jgi:hypothetical protein
VERSGSQGGECRSKKVDGGGGVEARRKMDGTGQPSRAEICDEKWNCHDCYEEEKKLAAKRSGETHYKAWVRMSSMLGMFASEG